ncbi:MAG: hypothetical protein JWM95_4478 [Gemmatimonadetes bacterium]|nr:hypothetical protein [Gemmatimonadota bacterium]
MLRWWVDPVLGSNSARAGAALQQLLELGGWQSRAVLDSADADLQYGPSVSGSNAIPFAGSEAWAAIETQTSVFRDGYWFPKASCIDGAGGPSLVDPVLAGYFFLSGRVDHDAHQKAYAGIPEQASIAEWHLHESPAVHRLVGLVAALVPPGHAPQPRWPRGKQWAMCLSHDCDRLRRYRTRGFWRDTYRRGANSAERVSSAAKALYSMMRLPGGTDPYEASTIAWLKFEQVMGVRGVYFVGTWSRSDFPSESYDLTYARSDPETLRLVSACKSYGAEMGLHSGIGAWRSPARFAEEVRRFRESYGIAPAGFRGHYWSLNPENPEESLAIAAEHGALKYDSSFGMNLAYGFRRGTCYPFRPFDAVTGRYSGLWELPPSVMDGGLYASAGTNEERVANFAALAASVQSAGGVLVLDWHSDSLWSGFMDNMTQALLPELTRLIDDSTCWVACASELIDWCSTARWTA